MSDPSNAKFVAPTSNLDGSAVTPGEIAKYILSVGLVPTDGSAQTFPTVFSDLDVTPAPDGTISIPLASFSPALAPGNYAGEVVAVTAGGASSAPSNVATFVISPPAPVIPNPPTGLQFV